MMILAAFHGEIARATISAGNMDIIGPIMGIISITPAMIPNDKAKGI